MDQKKRYEDVINATSELMRLYAHYATCHFPMMLNPNLSSEFITEQMKLNQAAFKQQSEALVARLGSQIESGEPH